MSLTDALLFTVATAITSTLLLWAGVAIRIARKRVKSTWYEVQYTMIETIVLVSLAAAMWFGIAGLRLLVDALLV